MKEIMNKFNLLRYILVIVIAVSSLPSIHAQVVYLSTTHPVYDFLKRLEAKQVINGYRDAARPLSRKSIAQFLLVLEEKRDILSPTEREQFEYYKTEFSYEMTSQGEDAFPTDLRWHPLSFELYDGVINFNLNYRVSFRRQEDQKLDVRGQGVRTYGYLYKNLGFYFNFVDTRESGNAINIPKIHTPEQGVIPSGLSGTNSREHNFTDVQLTYQFGKAELSVEKMENVWGLGTRGQLTFSRKPPTYPQFKLRIPLSKSIDFIYLHADLNSNEIDSSRSYFANTSALTQFFRPVNRNKYLAAHMIEFTPFDGIDVSLGESIIYSDRNVQLMYLLPIMFFKSGEHYNRDTDNSQFFGNLDLNLIPHVNLYASLFIDEIALAYLTDEVNRRNQLGFTVGTRVFDALIPDLDLQLEYTRNNPWVYTHKFPAADFTNSDTNYVLGHWIGQNADLFYAEASYWIRWNLKAQISYERYRKGGRTDILNQYSSPAEDFLYGPVRKHEYVGLGVRYEPLRDLFIDANARQVNIWNEANPSSNISKQYEFLLSFSYGLW